MRSWWCLAGCVAGLAGGAAAQSVRPWLLAVPGATATAVGVLWQRGHDDDEASVSGLSRVLVECRLHRARAAAPQVTRAGFSVGRDHCLAFAVAPADDVAVVRAFVAALLDDTLPIADDELRLIVARSALAADDDEFHYPGPMLETIARRRLFAGGAAARAPAGDAEALSRLAPDDVRRWLSLPPAPVRLAALGAVGSAVAEQLAALQPAQQLHPSAPTPQPRALPADAPAVEHSRVDAPFVSLAFAVERPSLSLALGVEVAKERARRRLRTRGTELLARAPLVRWSWAEDDALLQFCRRGEDPLQLLPGQPAEADRNDEAAATARELELLLADLRAVAPSAAELAAARAAVALELGLPGPDEVTTWAAQPALLPGRLQALMRRELHGIDLSGLAAATPAAVHRALCAALDEARRSRQTLLPVARAEFGFRTR